MFIYSLAQSQTKIIKIPLGTAFVTVDCFDPSVAEQDKDLYVRLYLNQTGAKEILLASYLPGSNKLKIEDPKQNGKIKVSATGKAVIDVAAITDKIGMNAVRCSSNSYNLDMDLIIKTTIYVYEPEKGISESNAATQKISDGFLTFIGIGVALLISNLVCLYVVMQKRRRFQKPATYFKYIDTEGQLPPTDHVTGGRFLSADANMSLDFAQSLAAGMENVPSAGMKNLPSAGMENVPSAGMENAPSARIYDEDGIIDALSKNPQVSKRDEKQFKYAASSFHKHDKKRFANTTSSQNFGYRSSADKLTGSRQYYKALSARSLKQQKSMPGFNPSSTHRNMYHQSFSRSHRFY